MINILEKVIDWIDNTLPIIIAPLVLIALVRIIYQMITY
jgi:hypothetical protein